MTTYHPGKLPHRVMRILADGPVYFGEIVDGLPSPWTRNKLARKVRFVLDALEADGLSKRDGRLGHSLTIDGRTSLAELNACRPVDTLPPAPSVRLFARAA